MPICWKKNRHVRCESAPIPVPGIETYNEPPESEQKPRHATAKRIVAKKKVVDAAAE